MNSILFTDSCSDLWPEYAQEHGIQIIPLSVLFRSNVYLDDYGISIPFDEFFSALRQGEMSSTSQANVEDFIQAWTPFLKEGKDILYIAFSSALSGTYSSGAAAKEQLVSQYPDRRILVVDSLCASLGQGLFVDIIRKKWQAGEDIQAIADWAEVNKLNVCHWFTVDDLNFLKRGGRVSGASAFLGSILDIKPVLHVNDEGKLIPIEKAKGRKKSIRALFERIASTAINPSESTVFISHADCLEDARFLASLIKEQLGVKDIQIGYIGPVITSHAGPGTLALFFFGTKR